LQYVEQERAYRQPDLTLGRLAKQLDIPRHHLSQVINEQLQCSFIDFINQYRVQEAMELLQKKEWQKAAVLAIGQEVGFQSKSTFYNAFKKFAQQTPAEFRKTTDSIKN